jgi:hypothetical protein
MLVLLSSLLACAKKEATPEEADRGAGWLYQHYADGAPADLADAIATIHDDIDAGTMTDALETTLTNLEPDAVAAVGRTAVESLPDDEQADVTEDDLDAGTYVRLADQQGMFIVSVIDCDLVDVETILAATNQDEMHGGYDAYERTWTSDGDAYFAGETDTLTWTTDYTVSVIGSTYHATIQGGLRHLSDDGSFRFGDVVLGRAVLPEPGVFDAGDGYFRQDYQLDMLWERAPGETIHAFALWRDLLVAGFHSSDPAFISLVSDRSVDADQEIEDLCSD